MSSYLDNRGRLEWKPRLKKWRVIWYIGKKDMPIGDYNTREEAEEVLQTAIKGVVIGK